MDSGVVLCSIKGQILPYSYSDPAARFHRQLPPGKVSQRVQPDLVSRELRPRAERLHHIQDGSGELKFGESLLISPNLAV